MGTDGGGEADTSADGGSKQGEKSYREILAEEIEKGVQELNRPRVGIFLSGLSAGLDIGFGPLLMVAILSTSTGDLSPIVHDLIVSSAYAVGFIFVVLGRSDLFTEHTTLAILPVLDGEASWTDLAWNWGLIYTSNIVGAAAFAGAAVVMGPAFDVVTPAAFGVFASHLIGFSWWATLLAAVFAGWLMGLLTWLVTASRDTTSEIISVWLVTLVIGYGHLPHSIAGTVEVLFGFFAGQGVSAADFGRFLLLSTVGNIVGGTVFVGLLKYGHATQAGMESGETANKPQDAE